MGNVVTNLQQKSIEESSSYLTNEGYKMILSSESLEDMKELSKDIIEAFDREHRSKILSKIRKKKELTKEEKVAINCLYALIDNIGKLVYEERWIKDEDRNYFLQFLGKYLKHLLPHIGSDIVAIRITEAILYTICNILDVTHISKKIFWTKVLLKYFQSKECSMETKLASTVAISYVAPSNMDIKQVEETMTIPVNLPCHDNQMGSSRSTDITLMGFEGDEIKRATERIIPNGQRPIHHACDNGNIDLVKSLIEQKCDINACDKNYRRPIHIACSKGHVEIVQLLIDQKCDMEACDQFGQRPIDVARDNEHDAIVKLLSRDSSDIEERDEVSIGIIKNDDVVNSCMDESHLSQIYELLLKIKDIDRKYISPQNISRLTKEAFRIFGVHFKSSIINRLENNSEISPRERLALNCVYASINVLGNLHQTDPSLTFSEEKDLQDIFECFFKLIKVNAIANRMCESILYAMCNIYQPPEAIADERWWRPKLKECYVEETCSGEMRLACSVLLGRMVTEDEDFDFNIFLFLLRTATLFTDGRSQYLGFTASEISNTAT